MLLTAKIILLLSLLFIFYQDLKDRKVYVFLFPLFGVLGSYLFFFNSGFAYYLLSICINLGIVIIVVLLTYLFAKWVLQKKYFKEAMGLGDILFFIAFAFCFPTIAFLNFFVFSILFTFVLHLALSKLLKDKNRNVPLAGYMSLFLMGIYLVNWLGFYEYLYLL